MSFSKRFIKLRAIVAQTCTTFRTYSMGRRSLCSSITHMSMSQRIGSSLNTFVQLPPLIGRMLECRRDYRNDTPYPLCQSVQQYRRATDYGDLARQHYREA